MEKPFTRVPPSPREDREQDEFQRRSMTSEEAKMDALRTTGGGEAEGPQRKRSSLRWLDDVWQDARHAVRSLSKSPLFVAAAVLSLAFGIGVNTTIFTLVNGILLKKLPVSDPERVVQIVNTNSYPVLRALRGHQEIFQDVVGFWAYPATLNAGSGGNKIDVLFVTGSYFSFFDARPALGRLLDEQDDLVEGGNSVCVISYKVWQNHFGGDSQVFNRAIHVNGIPLQVVGVAEPGFVGAELQRRFDIWTPSAAAIHFRERSRDSTRANWLSMLGLLAPGISLEQANARLRVVSPAVNERAGARRMGDRGIYEVRDASKGYDSWRTTLRDPLTILMGAVVVVLLVACTNLANLLLARATERQQEFATKIALGISRLRLLRQLFLELLLLTLGGGALAFLLSLVLTPFLLVLFNAGSRYASLEVRPDTTVLLFTFGTCLVCGLIAGLYPAWQVSRSDCTLGLKGVSPTGTRGRFVRRTLILAQITLAVVLLFVASLFTHSLWKLKTVSLGYDISRILAVEVAQGGLISKGQALTESSIIPELLSRIDRLPSVEAVAFCWPGVLTGDMIVGSFKAKNENFTRPVNDSHYLFTSPGYFSTMGIPLLSGRDFRSSDLAGTRPVAIVNRHLALKTWPGQNPVGQRFDGLFAKNVEVIGVVENHKYREVREATLPIVYQVAAQKAAAGLITGGTLQVRFIDAEGQVERDIEQIVDSTAPGLHVAHAATMTLLRDNLIAKDRLLAFLSSLFACLATSLALIGIYGLISYAVTRRTREIGIRMGLGAQRGHILWLFLGETLALLAGGILIGMPLALGLARLLGSLLYEVSVSNPVDIVITLSLVILGGLLAAYLPSRRGTTVNAVQALRHD